MKHGPRHSMLLKRQFERDNAHELVGFIPGRMSSKDEPRDHYGLVAAILALVAVLAFVGLVLNGVPQ